MPSWFHGINAVLAGAATVATIGAATFGILVGLGIIGSPKPLPTVDLIGVAEARPGQEVDISGENLNLVSEVLLTRGSTTFRIPFVRASESRLTVTVPDAVGPDDYILEFRTTEGVVATGQTLRVILVVIPTSTPIPTVIPTLVPTATATSTSPAPTNTPIPTATQVPTPTPIPPGPSNETRWTGSSININPERNTGQSFKPISSKLLTVEVAVLAVESGMSGVGGDTLTMTLSSESGGNILAEVSRPVLGGFEGWLRFEIPGGGIEVTPHRTLILKLQDTGKSIFEWKYAGDTYPDGTLIFSNTLSPPRDTFFRINHP